MALRHCITCRVLVNLVSINGEIYKHFSLEMSQYHVFSISITLLSLCDHAKFDTKLTKLIKGMFFNKFIIAHVIKIIF